VIIFGETMKRIMKKIYGIVLGIISIGIFQQINAYTNYHYVSNQTNRKIKVFVIPHATKVLPQMSGFEKLNVNSERCIEKFIVKDTETGQTLISESDWYLSRPPYPGYPVMRKRKNKWCSAKKIIIRESRGVVSLSIESE